ncbi:MAG: arylsulfatase A-like enzyme [Planctomycetota bacterium]|jgi:arylsulfatase A-like enzyme
MQAKLIIGKCCLAVFSVATMLACGESTSAPRSVIWIEVDTLRADALGCYGSTARGEGGTLPSPSIDGLASSGVLFERAYSSAPWTVPSFMTQLSGKWPFDHGALRLLAPVEFESPNLAERFQNAGWRTACVMTNFVVQQQLGFDRGFEVWDESLAEGHQGATGPEAAELMLSITDEFLKRPGEGLFLLLFLFEPHNRYEAHPGMRFGPGYSDDAPYQGKLTGMEPISNLRSRRESFTEADIEFLRGRYQSEVAHVDGAIGKLLVGMRERELLDEALVVFTADHGEELMERGWLGHTRTLYDELVRVPLVIQLPSSIRAGHEGVRLDAAVSQIDLGSTVLDLMGVEGSLGDGVSFASTILERAPSPRRYLYLHSDFDPPLQSASSLKKRALLWGVVDAQEEDKWIIDRHPDHRVKGRPATQWFDLNADPGEERDLTDSSSVPKRFFSMPALDPDVPTGELKGLKR